MEEEKIVSNIYPRLKPTAPPNDYVEMNHQDETKRKENIYGVDNKINYVNDVKKYLETNSESRRSLAKKYGKANTVLYYTNYTLNFITASTAIASAATLPTVVMLPLSMALSGVSAVCGTLGFALNKLSKKLKIKQQKHNDIHNLANTKLNTIECLLSKALENNHIDHSELILILDERVRFDQYKDAIRQAKNKKFFEQNDIKKSFKKLIS